MFHEDSTDPAKHFQAPHRSTHGTVGAATVIANGKWIMNGSMIGYDVCGSLLSPRLKFKESGSQFQMNEYPRLVKGRLHSCLIALAWELLEKTEMNRSVGLVFPHQF